MKPVISEAIEQMQQASDFESPSLLLNDLSEEDALRVPEGAPYSIARVVKHASVWQNLFLSGVLGWEGYNRPSSAAEDWPLVEEGSWEQTRKDFLEKFDQIAQAASGEDPSRMLSHGQNVQTTLTRLMLHNTYHLGEIALLRQLLGLWPVKGGEDLWKADTPQE
jgi:uncharacterized damage-inducible protein DinB